MLPASIDPSALPAPTIVCNSSMNRMICPSCFARSFNTAFSLSSNSPRNLAPAIRAPISSDRMRLFRNPSGISLLTMRCARPSMIAVLPTPGSPIRTGLFLVLRCNIWIVRRISSSRPITGSSLPCSARSVRSIVYLSSAWRVSSAFGSSTLSPPRRSSIDFSTAPRTAPACSNIAASGDLLSIAARTNISLEINWSSLSCANLSVRFSSLLRSEPMCTSPPAPSTLDMRSIASPSFERSRLTFAPDLVRSPRADPPC